MNAALLSSKKMDYCTPQDFFDRLNEEFHFTLDAAATDKSAKCPAYYTPETDGLTAPIVPHTSNYAAMLNAAEYWGCDWLEIIDDVEVWAVGPDAVPVKMPRHERNGR